MAVIITDIEPMSFAEKCNILPGETLLTINGNEIIDVLDYRFYQVNKKLILEIRDKVGIVRIVKITKPEYAEIGLLFSDYLMDEQHSCKNKCIFCFIDQLPKGLRESLYFKDDDSRLSFLFGNYITLTNLSDHEIDRIIKMHISPINVSVHTTNPELRCKMMGNRFAGKKLSILKRFADAGLVLNCQIVACPGINDGDELIRTLNDLIEMNVETVAVVPVGLTDYREGLFELIPYTKETANDTIDIIEAIGNKCKLDLGRRVVFASDEFYIKAERPLPDVEFYEDFACLENGVGMITLLKDELLYALEEDIYDVNESHSVTIACGVSVYPYMKENMDMIMEKYKNIKINTVKVENKFFGKQINVSGLIVGRNLIDTLKNVELGDRLIIPSVMLRNENDLFLDNVSIDDVEKELNIKVIPVNNKGEDLLKYIVERGI